MRQNKLFKAFSVHLLSFALLFGPMPLLAAEKTGPTVDNSEWVGTAAGIMDSVGKQILQSKQQQANMRQQAAMMQNLKPKVVPAKFFPQCQISPAGASVPINACKPSQNLQQSIQMSRTLQNAAQQNMDFYEQLQDEAQNSPMPSGIACLKQAMQGVKTSIQDRVNALERLKEQITKSNQLFEEVAKKDLEDIKRNGNELYGARGGKFDVNQETAEYHKLVTPECRDIVGQDKFKTLIYKTGFLGLRDGKLSDLNQKATQLMSNKATYEDDLNQKVKQMKSDIKKYGVDGFAAMNSGSLAFERNGQEKFGSLNKAFKDMMTEKQTEIGNIRNKIKSELGGGATASKLDGLMRLDENFKTDFAEFTNQAEQQLEREHVSECVSGPIGLSTNQILSSLRYDNNGMTGDTIVNYRTSLEGILNSSDASAAEKKAQMISLDARFKGRVKIVYNDDESIRRDEKPYEMFQKIIVKCQNSYNQKTDNNVGRSTKKKVERAKKYMRDLQKVERTFASDLSNHLIDEVINCSGRKLKAGQCNSSSGALSTSSDGFCLAQASECAGQANSCYAQINKQVKERQNNLNGLTTKYNNNVAALITGQEKLLSQVKAQVQRDSEFFKGFFPGATYDYPEDLLVKLPQLADFQGMKGVELRGGGDIETLKTLPSKIAKLQDALLAQWQGGGKTNGQGIQGVINDYIAQQQGAMDKNSKKWAALKKQCTQTEQQAIAAVNAANQKAQEAYGETKQKVGEFCQRFDDLRSNPAAGCNDDYDVNGLYEDGMKVSAHIDDDAKRYVGTYRALCAQSQNEKDTEKEGDDSAIQETCTDEGSDAALALMLETIEGSLEGQLTTAEFNSIKEDDNTLTTPEIAAILKKLKGQKHIANIVKKYVKFNSKEYKKELGENFDELQKVIDIRTAEIEKINGSDSAGYKRGAEKEATKLKRDKGFCSEGKISNFADSVGESKTPKELRDALKEYETSDGAKTVDRSIASISTKSSNNQLSAMGQAEYDEISCEATASNGRFGGDMFDSFDQGILGSDASSILSGLGK